MYCGLEPTHDQIAFQFIEDTTNGRFNQQTASGVIVVDQKDKQVDYARWVRVLAVGPDVSEWVDVDDLVLVEHLQWTNGFIIDDDKIWLTNESSILAVLDDEENAPGEIKNFL